MKITLSIIICMLFANTVALSQFNSKHPNPKSFKYYNDKPYKLGKNNLRIAQLYANIDNKDSIANLIVFYSDGMVKILYATLGENFDFLTSKKYFVERSKTGEFGYYKLAGDTVYWTKKVFYNKKEKEYIALLSDSGKVLKSINSDHKNSKWTLIENNNEYLPKLYANRNYYYSYEDTIKEHVRMKVVRLSFSADENNLQFDFEKTFKPIIRISYDDDPNDVKGEIDPKVKIRSYDLCSNKDCDILIEYRVNKSSMNNTGLFQLTGKCINNCDSIIFVENEYNSLNKLVKTRSFMAAAND